MKHISELINIANDTLHHCSSIVVVPGLGRVIAAYLGPECEDAQKVFVMALDKPGLLLKLSKKTGNPLLWHDKLNSKIYLLYSLFEDKDDKGNKPLSMVQRWMYCSTWLAELDPITFTLKNEHKVDGGFGLLARCAPYTVAGRTYVPLYREKDPRCELWEIRNGSLYRVSIFGDKLRPGFSNSKLGDGIAIQPTLIFHDNALLAFCRNVNVDAKNAWVFKSHDFGLSWSDPSDTPLPNHNNSLVAIPWRDDYMVVLNNDRQRGEIFLSNRYNTMRLGIPIVGTRSSYSYPNYCIDGDDLHIIHSNRGVLAVHRMDREFVDVTMVDQSKIK